MIINFSKRNPDLTIIALLIVSISFLSFYSPIISKIVSKIPIETLRIISHFVPFATFLEQRINAVKQQVQECQTHANPELCVHEKLEYQQESSVNAAESPIQTIIAILGAILLVWMLFPCRKIFSAVKDFILIKIKS